MLESLPQTDGDIEIWMHIYIVFVYVPYESLEGAIQSRNGQLFCNSNYLHIHSVLHFFVNFKLFAQLPHGIVIFRNVVYLAIVPFAQKDHATSVCF